MLLWSARNKRTKNTNHVDLTGTAVGNPLPFSPLLPPPPGQIRFLKGLMYMSPVVSSAGGRMN